DPRVLQAISIARLLRDPLIELTRQDLRSLDVGSYHGDVDQEFLGAVLSEVAQSCVAHVGVDLNSAEAHLLACVPGLDRERAVALRERAMKEPFRSRAELRSFPGFDEQRFHWSGGFLRIRGGDNPLDGTGIHPDQYELVGTMAAKLGLEPKDLLGNSAALDSLDPQGFVGDGLPLETVQYTFTQLRDGGRDPRATFDPPQFRDDLKSLEDLKEGMTLEGVVTKLASFGAFVDVGVDQEGLIHVSEISDEFVGDAGDHVRLWQKLTVRILGVDLERRRLSLSIRSPGARKPRRAEDGRGPRDRRPGGPGGEARRPRPRPAAADGPVPGAAVPAAEGAPGVRRERKRWDDRKAVGEGPREGDRRRKRDRPGRSEDRTREGGEADRDGRRGGRRGSGEEGGGERSPRVIEQKARREAEPEIDPNLPETEQFRLKLERLRRKFEKGR
ncbi:MAG: S1 RNA-binding domain-containing protein, partial [Planctomycetes bacterium]|nr:S1 RNA-binding domain-containing protein [Planctomycetota bacterium]